MLAQMEEGVRAWIPQQPQGLSLLTRFLAYTLDQHQPGYQQGQKNQDQE
jgi:hypothetical protein